MSSPVSSPARTALSPNLHPELDLVAERFRAARAQPPEAFSHWPGVIEQPSFFGIAALQQHLANPLLPPNWLALVFRGQHIPLEQACGYKIVQTKQLVFMDKRVLDGYLAQGASVVLEGLDVLDPGINAFMAELDAGFPIAFANCVAFFSQRGNEAYRGHFDSDAARHLVDELVGDLLPHLTVDVHRSGGGDVMRERGPLGPGRWAVQHVVEEAVELLVKALR